MKKVYLFPTLLLLSLSLFGQNIKLPDVTTVIEGESKKAGKDALPEFKSILEKTKGSGTIVPELPDVDNSGTPETVIANNNKSEKSVFSEIVVGGGYPFLFYGDFDISGVDQANPFKFDFKFDSAKAFNGTSVNNNYSDKIINMSFDKRFKKDDLTFGLNAGYKSLETGFQGKSSGFTSNNYDFINGTGNINYNFSNGIYIGGNLNLDFYNRYASIDEPVNSEEWLKRVGVFTVEPEVCFGWQGYGFDVGLWGIYNFGFNVYESVIGGNNHRGDFTLKFQWQNDLVKTYGKCSFVMGNQIKDNWFLIPFTVGFDINIPVTYSNRKFAITGEGGLLTEFNNLKDLEGKYKFAALSVLPSESADWYGKLNIDVPVKSTFTGNIAIEYKETAFNNGVWEPDYSDKSFVNGLYRFTEKNHKVLTTDFSLTYHHDVFSIKGGWHSNWLDIPVLEPMQAITLNLSFQDKKAKWGASLFGSYDVNNSGEMPIVNIDCFTQITQKVRITASVGDLITVFNSNTRNYAGKYLDRGFEAGLFLKFVM